MCCRLHRVACSCAQSQPAIVTRLSRAAGALLAFTTRHGTHSTRGGGGAVQDLRGVLSAGLVQHRRLRAVDEGAGHAGALPAPPPVLHPALLAQRTLCKAQERTLRIGPSGSGTSPPGAASMCLMCPPSPCFAGHQDGGLVGGGEALLGRCHQVCAVGCRSQRPDQGGVDHHQGDRDGLTPMHAMCNRLTARWRDREADPGG